MKKLLFFVFLLAVIIVPPSFAGERVAEHKGGNEGDGSVTLTPEAIKEAGIVVEPLVKKYLATELNAPGEVRLNSYLSSKITPRITAQVLARHVRLGDKVKKGTPLLSLSSVAMAEAAGKLLVANQEWQRIKKLGKRAVSAKRYNEVKIADKQARARVIAYGMTERQVKELLLKGSSGTPGVFQLVALQKGVVVSDDFIEGELIEPGRVLFNITDESSLWVESRLSPKLSEAVKANANARVKVPGNGWIKGRVTRRHHLLDEETRTIGIRIEVNNRDGRLHPGMFVDTKIETGKGKKYLAVPTKSVLRSPDGDWILFVEQKKAGSFKPQEVEVVETIQDYTIIKGLPEGSRIVTSGAFFVRSELAKSGFAVHNH